MGEKGSLIQISSLLSTCEKERAVTAVHVPSQYLYERYITFGVYMQESLQAGSNGNITSKNVFSEILKRINSKVTFAQLPFPIVSSLSVFFLIYSLSFAQPCYCNHCLSSYFFFFSLTV